MLRILLVDDVPEWHNLLARVFAGHVFEWAPTAQDAFRMLEEQQFDAVLLDGKLPGDIDGPALAKLIRLRFRERGECEPQMFGLTGYPEMTEAFQQAWIPTLLKGMGVVEMRHVVENLVMQVTVGAV
jgi:CheY-like chemotaxis protein